MSARSQSSVRVLNFTPCLISYDEEKCLGSFGNGSPAYCKLDLYNGEPFLTINASYNPDTVYRHASICAIRTYQINIRKCSEVVADSSLLYQASGIPQGSVQSYWVDDREAILPDGTYGGRGWAGTGDGRVKNNYRYIELKLAGVVTDDS